MATDALQFGTGNTARHYRFTGPALGTGDFCIGFWFRMDNMLSGTNGVQYIVSSGSLGASDTINIFVQEPNQGGALVAYFANSSAAVLINDGPTPAGGSSSWPRDGTAYLGVVQRRGSNYQLYLTPKGGATSQVLTGTISNYNWTSKTWYFGARGDLNTSRFWLNAAGELFVLVGDSLTAAEIITLAAGKHITDVKSTRAVDLRFRGNNATETDLSGNARNATQYGTGWTLANEFFPNAALTPRRALTVVSGVRQQVDAAQLGTGLKPFVLDTGILKLRSAAEGTPVVWVNGVLRTLASNESLEI